MRTFLASLALATVSLGVAPGWAAPPPPAAPATAQDDAKNAARALAKKGYDLYDAGRYDEAFEALQEAERRYHAPTLVFMLGKASAKLGKLIAARTFFERVQDEKLPPTASADFRKAQALARQELAALRPIIPRITVQIRGAAGAPGLIVKLDQLTLSLADLDHPIDVDPGSHLIEVTTARGDDLRRKVTIAAKEAIDVDIGLPSGPARQASPSAPSAPNVPGAPRSRWLTPSLIAFGAGAAGLGVGIGAGVVTLDRAAAIKAHCTPEGVCPESQRRSASSASNLAAVSTAGFVVAGAGAALGATFLVLRARDRAPADAALVIGPGSLSLEGTF
ncbi:MAG: tetratricopeptide repeat protein [Byssovorax sp.]